MLKRRTRESLLKLSPVDRLCPRASNAEIVQILDKLGLLEKVSPVLKAKGILPANKNDDKAKLPEPEIPPDEIFRGVVAYVEVKTGTFDVSNAFRSRISAAGGEVAATINQKVNHVVFKDGRISTYKKATQRNLPVVNTLWVVESLKSGRCLPTQDFIAIDPEIERQEKLKAKSKKDSPFQFLLRMARSAERERKRELARKQESSKKQGCSNGNPSPFVPKMGEDRKANSRKRLFSASDADQGQSKGVVQKRNNKKQNRRVTCLSDVLAENRRDSIADFKVARRKQCTSSTAQSLKDTDPKPVSSPSTEHSHEGKRKTTCAKYSQFSVETNCATPRNSKLKPGSDNKQFLSTDAGIKLDRSESQLCSNNKGGASNVDFASLKCTTRPADVTAQNGCPAPDLNSCPAPDLNGCPVPNLNACPVPNLNDCPVPDLIGCPAPDLNGCPAPDLNGCPAPDLNGSPVTLPVTLSTRKRGRRTTTGAPFCTPIQKEKSKRPKVRCVKRQEEANGETPACLEVQKSTAAREDSSKADSELHEMPAAKPRSLPSLVVTSCQPSDRDAVTSVVGQLGCFEVTMEVVESTSHLICGQKKRTMSMLLAMAQGAWVLPLEWVYQSLEAGKWLKEDDFELADYFPGVKLSRLARLEEKSGEQRGLLSDVGPIFLGPKSTVPTDKMTRIISLMGGKVVGSAQASKVVIQDTQVLPSRRSRISDKQVASSKWILDCLSGYKLVPMF